MRSRDNSPAPEILITPLPHAGDLELPAYATDRSVGMDLAAAIGGDLVIEPGHTALVPTGFAIAIPEGYEAQVRPRSGLALENGITIPNSPGTIDPDYRGEIKVILLNLGPSAFRITRGMRIAQMVIAPAVQASLKVVDELPPTERGEGGFGHSGK
ncbi:MAG: dUTP diphosphatase [bacterium]|nr:MAG: dUTP diphosphatase [bacterium]